MISQFAKDSGKEDIILNNNNNKEQELNVQIEIFSEIIIDIYLQNEKHYEKGKPTDGS